MTRMLEGGQKSMKDRERESGSLRLDVEAAVEDPRLF